MIFRQSIKTALFAIIVMALYSFSLPTSEPNIESDNYLFLKEGDKAPNFVTKDVLGNKINLNRVLKQGNVLITFLRPAWCPICNARTYELINSYEEMKKKGIEIIAVYPSSEEELRGYVKDMSIPFTVISDPDEELFKLYGVERSAAKFKRTLKEDKALKAIKEGEELYEKNGNNYGGLRDVATPIIPADFIINKSKVIKTAHYGDFIGDYIPVKNIEENLTYNFNLPNDMIRF